MAGVFTGLFIILLVIFAFKEPYRRRAVQQRIRKARHVIDFSFAGGVALGDRLALRSKSNLRLVHAFGIDNSFTTVDTVTHKAFVTKATKLLNRMRTTEQWQTLHHTAETLLQRDIKVSIEKNTLVINDNNTAEVTVNYYFLDRDRMKTVLFVNLHGPRARLRGANRDHTCTGGHV